MVIRAFHVCAGREGGEADEPEAEVCVHQAAEPGRSGGQAQGQGHRDKPVSTEKVINRSIDSIYIYIYIDR